MEEYKRTLEESNRTDPDKLAELLCLALVIATFWYAATDTGWAVLVNSTANGSSSIDWCEDNYVYSDYVAEWWNTISSLPMVWVAFKMHTLTSKGPALIRPSVALIPISFFFVGVGSAYFHGSLSAAGQILDEMPINLANFYAITGLRSKRNLAKVFGDRLTNVMRSDYFAITFVAVVPLASILWPMVSHVLCVSMMPTTTYFTVSAYQASSPEFQKRMQSCYRGAVYGTWGAGACWIIDKLGCDTMHAIQDWSGFMPQFHALWHILIFCGAWHVACLLFAIMCIEENIPKHKWTFVEYFPGEQRWFLPKVAKFFAVRFPGNVQFRMLEDLDGVAIKY